METTHTPRPKKRLLDQVRDAIHLKQYSPRTEDAYVHWVKRFIYSHGIRLEGWKVEG